MRVLALDTTTRAGSVAIVEDDAIVDERRGDAARTHAERLPAELLAIAAANHVALPDVDLYAVASGPGSFTGLRIGIATMQGLAFVQQRQIVGIGGLEALAHLAASELPADAYVGAWMDAHRREVFTALYRVTDVPLLAARRLEPVEAPAVGNPGLALARWAALLAGAPVVFIGDGAVMYADAIAQAVALTGMAPSPPLAGVIGRLAIACARRGEAVEPGGIQPLYLRRPDAEIARAEKTR